MTVWKLAMIALLVFGLINPAHRWSRLRVGLVMLGASFVAALFPNLWFYLAIDLAIAALILLPPRSTWQKAIAVCYLWMALLTIGFIGTIHFSSSAVADPKMLMSAHDVFTWAATCVLFLWGADGIVGGLYPSARPVRSALLADKSNP